MKNFAPYAAIITSVLLPVGVFAQDSHQTIQILRTGKWHGDEVSVEAGADWWGIFAEGDGYALQHAPVTITPRVDAIMSDSPDNPTGKKVEVAQEVDPVFLVRGLKSPVEGKLNTPVTASLPRVIYPDKGIDLRLRDIDQPEFVGIYTLGKVKTFSGPTDIGFEDHEIVLYSGRKGEITEQTLAVIPGETDGKPQLEWAGDLDRDGKVDILYNITNHYNVRHLVLYLSTAAEGGELVGKVCEWRTVGC